ncbi:hypothetical protein BsWGS_00789 [Bradybaena similaris]
MTTANRASPRSPGRTPPFILIGLLVIVGFLAFSYWRLTSTNNDLLAQLETAEIEKKDLDQRTAETEKNLENSREELRASQGKLDQTRKQLQDKESEINNLKADLSAKQADAEKSKTLLSSCDAVVAEQKVNLETQKNEKAELEKQLNDAKQNQPVCDVAGCMTHVKLVAAVGAKFVGSDAFIKGLNEVNFDGAKILEGIQIPPPAAQVDASKKAEAQQQSETKAGDSKQQGADGKQQNASESQVNNRSEVSSSKNNMNVNVTDSSDISHIKKLNDTLVVESERGKTIADISSLLAQSELEKQQRKETDDAAEKGDAEDEDEDENNDADATTAKEHDGDVTEKDDENDDAQ